MDRSLTGAGQVLRLPKRQAGVSLGFHDFYSAFPRFLGLV